MRFFDLDELENDRNFWYSAVGLVAFSGLILAALDNFDLAVIVFGFAFTLFAVAYEEIGEEE